MIQAESEDETMGLRVYGTLQGALPTPPTLPSASLSLPPNRASQNLSRLHVGVCGHTCQYRHVTNPPAVRHTRTRLGIWHFSDD